MVRASAKLNLRVQGGMQLESVARALREAGRRDLRANMTKRLRAEGKPSVRAVRTAVRSVPVKGTSGGGRKQRGGTGLRALIADATQVSLRTGGRSVSIRIRVADSRFAPYEQGTLPKYLDGEIARFSRWRHPVFGDTDRWVQQDSHPYFFVTLRARTEEYQRAILRAIDDTLEELIRA